MDDVVIEIRSNKDGSYLRVPVTPETIQYNDGDALVNTVKIIGLGNIDFHDGVDLDSFGWSRFFPSRYDPAYCTTSDLLDPIEYRNVFSSWKDNDADLQLICAAAGINKSMKLITFTWELKGAEGDIYYTVNFRERKTSKPQQIDVTTNSSGIITIARNKPTPAARPAAATNPKPKTYTVKQGDILIAVAKNFGITPWSTLYDKNKNVMGPDPGVIKPGQVLTL